MSIPARVHFCWIGSRRLPWAYVFAILSAAERSELPELFLHHTDTLEDGPELAALRRAPRVQLVHVEPQVTLAKAGAALGIGDGLVAIYRKLASPVMRADVLRAAILYLEGGIYLDLDTITTKSLRPLLDTPQFIGTEIIVWPQRVRLSRSPLVLVRHVTLDLLRKAIRNLPNGWKIFRHVEGLYPVAVNNAVMGAQAGTNLFADYLRAMLEVPLGNQPQAYALGPHLLQEVVDQYQESDLTVHAPQVFYPLPPEISAQWFRTVGAARLDAVLSAETRVVHWYASVRTKLHVAQIDPAYVRAHRAHQLYSALVCACINHLPAPDER